MTGRSMRKSKRGGRNYVVGVKKGGATKKHYRKANKTRRGRKGSKKHSKKTHRRRRHRGGNLIGWLAGNFRPAVSGPLQKILGDDAARTKLKLDAKQLRAAEIAVANDVQQGYKAAKKTAASIVNQPGSGWAVALNQQLANSQPQDRAAFPNNGLVRP